MRDQPSAPALYPDARPPAPGDVLRRPALAAILRDIGEQGREAFYTGRIAEAIVGATDGMIGSRARDRLGIVGWYNEFSSDFAPTLDDSSSGFEAYYSFQVTPWLQFGPDIQYLIDPGLAAGEDDTTVLGARALIHF